MNLKRRIKQREVDQDHSGPIQAFMGVVEQREKSYDATIFASWIDSLEHSWYKQKKLPTYVGGVMADPIEVKNTIDVIGLNDIKQ